MKHSEGSFRIYIEDMITSIDRILNYAEKVKGLEEFMSNQLIIDATVRNFEIIGEASKKIPDEVKNLYPNVPWRQMYRLRNIVSHEYASVDIALLWGLIQNELVKNKISLEEILTK